MTARRDPERSAERLVRLYPRAWRARYGAELTELLVADIADCPHSRRRAADVVRAALIERLATAGLAAGASNTPRRALVTVGAATLGFLAIASSFWAQLLGGSLVFSGPDGSAARLGATVLTLTAGFFGVLLVLAVLPVLPALTRAVRHRGGAVRRPTGLVVAAVSILALGGHRLSGRWPAIGADHSGLATRIGSYGWAETLGISTYWVHPHRLFALPADELTWMVLSPLAVIALLAGLVSLARQVAVPARVLRFEAKLATVAAIGMAPALAAATAWVVSSQHDPHAMFRAGTLDLVLIAAMTSAVAAAGVAADGIRAAAAPRAP